MLVLGKFLRHLTVSNAKWVSNSNTKQHVRIMSHNPRSDWFLFPICARRQAYIGYQSLNAADLCNVFRTQNEPLTEALSEWLILMTADQLIVILTDWPTDWLFLMTDLLTFVASRLIKFGNSLTDRLRPLAEFLTDIRNNELFSFRESYLDFEVFLHRLMHALFLLVLPLKETNSRSFTFR